MVRTKYRAQKQPVTNGFTFVEILVVATLAGIVMMGTVGMLLSILRSSRKSEAITNLKQVGDHALEIISSKVRNAQTITCAAVGNTYTIQATSYQGTTTDFSLTCDPGGDGEIKQGENALISPDIGIEITACSLVCTPGGEGIPGTAEIGFTLSSGLDPASQASVHFKTTVSLRNY